jgi:YVTN family beta-propeller protein
MNLKKLILTTITVTLLFVSCSPDSKDTNIFIPSKSYLGGVFILNEGGFGQANSNVSYLSNDLDGLEKYVYTSVNPNLEKGDVGQNIGFYRDYAYIVFNNSNRIEVVNRSTFKSIGTIKTGLKNPRYIAFANGNAYVTNWGDPNIATDDYVLVIDLATNTIKKNIPVVEGPEKIIESKGKLYVANQGGYSNNDKITVIDSGNNIVVGTAITVGDIPGSLQIVNDELWVGCKGITYPATSETSGSLVKINLTSLNVTETLTFANATEHLENLTLSGSNIYFTKGTSVFKMALTDKVLPTKSAFLTNVEALYGFAINNGRIFIGDAKDFKKEGSVFIYSLGEPGSNPIGTPLRPEITLGVGPNGFYFNK